MSVKKEKGKGLTVIEPSSPLAPITIRLGWNVRALVNEFRCPKNPDEGLIVDNRVPFTFQTLIIWSSPALNLFRLNKKNFFSLDCNFFFYIDNFYLATTGL